MIFVDNRRFEIQTNAILLKHDCHCAALASSSLNDRYRIFATSQETRLLSIHRDQIWLGKSAQGTLRLQRADHGGHVTAQNQKIERAEGAAQHSCGNVTSIGWSATGEEPSHARGCLVRIRGTEFAHPGAIHFGDSNQQLYLPKVFHRRFQKINSFETGRLDNGIGSPRNSWIANRSRYHL